MKFHYFRTYDTLLDIERVDLFKIKQYNENLFAFLAYIEGKELLLHKGTKQECDELMSQMLNHTKHD